MSNDIQKPAETSISDGVLRPGEYHPATDAAFKYLAELPLDTLTEHMKTLANQAVAGSRCAGVCLHTLNAMLSGNQLADRYILGAAWTVKELEASKSCILLG